MDTQQSLINKELLEALRALLATKGDGMTRRLGGRIVRCSWCALDEGSHDVACVGERARAAIARAKGE